MAQGRIIAGIISWEGRRDAALAIATDIRDAVDDVVVVYSNADDLDEAGPGRWIKTPQSAFFGAKFAALLQHVAEGDALLLIQADACSDDWPGLARRFRVLAAQRPEMGLWSPNIDYSPFPNALVATGKDSEDLYRVLQTDGVVLGVHPRVLGRLSRLDYRQNNLGWGIDWAAVGFCVVNGLLVLRDCTRLVMHPRSRDYDSASANSQMEGFLRQLDAAELAVVRSCRQRVDLNATRMRNLAHVAASTGGSTGSRAGPGVAALTALGSQVDFMVVQTGRVLLAPRRGGQAFHVRCNGRDAGAAPRRDAAALPRVLGLNTDCGPDARAEVSDAQWSCPGQPTWRYVFRKAGPVRVDLLESIEIGANLKGVCLRMGAAVHRATAGLRFEWHDASDPAARTEKWIKLDPRFNGDADTGSYQKIAFPIPDTGGTRILNVSLHYWTRMPDPKKPGMAFCTRPFLLGAADGEAPTLPVVLIAPDAKGDCVPTLEIAVEPSRSDLVVVTADREYLLVSAANVNARIRADAGVLMAEADAPALCTLFVDGSALRTQWLGPEPTAISVPAQRQAGTVARVELRDPTGNIVYASHPLASTTEPPEADPGPGTGTSPRRPGPSRN
jgi:hypothetical protein